MGVDSYQTTYERAFIRGGRGEPPDVDVVVLDAGGDVARQIAQIQDLVQQGVDAMIIWPTNGPGPVISPPCARRTRPGIPVVIHLNLEHSPEDGFDFIRSFLGGPTTSRQGSRAAEGIMCERFTDMGIQDEARVGPDHRASPATPPPSSARRASRSVCPRSART